MSDEDNNFGGTFGGEQAVQADAVVTKIEKKPVEFSGMQTFLVDLINAEDNLTKLRAILEMVLGLGGETIEMQQLTLMKLEWDREIAQLKSDVKRWNMVTKALAVGVVLVSGYVGLDIAGILKILGVGV